MKPFAVTLLIVIVYFAFVSRVSAQCIDYASCVGERAEIDARLRPWARETAEAKAEERRAAATERAYNRMIALTATEAARPTRTPVPTVTAQPSATSFPTVTPIPSATPQPTPNLGATVVGVFVQAVSAAQPTPKPVAQDVKNDKTAIYIFAGFAAIVIVAAVAVLLFKPETYTFYK